MKILQIVNYYYPHIGGIEQVAMNIANSLKDNNIKQKIICFNENVKRNDLFYKRNETIKDIIDDIEIIRCASFLKISSQSLSLIYYKELKKLLNEFKPDIIIFHYPNPFVASLLLKLIDNHTKLIIYWHLDIIKQKILKHFFHKQNLKLLSRANKIIATSPNYIEGSNYLTKYKDKCLVIPNCIANDYISIDEEIIYHSKEIKDKYKDKCICFTIGRHVPYKGYEYLIEASKYLDDNYIFLIGGEGPLTNKLKSLATNNKKIEFLGYLNNQEIKAYYLAADIITFSSITKNEAFGISLAEGMSFSKPAITFNIPGSGVNYVNLDSITGIEVENRNVKAYANAIKELYLDKEKYQEYASNAKQRLDDYFTFDKFKNNINDLIKET